MSADYDLLIVGAGPPAWPQRWPPRRAARASPWSTTTRRRRTDLARRPACQPAAACPSDASTPGRARQCRALPGDPGGRLRSRQAPVAGRPATWLAGRLPTPGPLHRRPRTAAAVSRLDPPRRHRRRRPRRWPRAACHWPASAWWWLAPARCCWPAPPAPASAGPPAAHRRTGAGENPGRLRRTPAALARQAVAGRRPVRP